MKWRTEKKNSAIKQLYRKIRKWKWRYHSHEGNTRRRNLFKADSIMIKHKADQIVKIIKGLDICQL